MGFVSGCLKSMAYLETRIFIQKLKYDPLGISTGSETEILTKKRNKKKTSKLQLDWPLDIFVLLWNNTDEALWTWVLSSTPPQECRSSPGKRCWPKILITHLNNQLFPTSLSSSNCDELRHRFEVIQRARCEVIIVNSNSFWWCILLLSYSFRGTRSEAR